MLDTMKISERIKAIRKYYNLSQEKFAQKISVSTGYVSCMEIGYRKINDRILKLIVTEFGINENWIRYGTGNMLNNDNKTETELFLELCPEFQQYILKKMKELKKIQDENEKKT